jgi:hypothetical protein
MSRRRAAGCCNGLLGGDRRSGKLGCTRCFASVGSRSIWRRQSHSESFQSRKCLKNCFSCLLHIKGTRESKEEDVAGAVGP